MSLFSFSEYTVEKQNLDIMTHLCQTVSGRSAQLAAALISLIEQQEGLKHPIVTDINGVTFEKCSRLKGRIYQLLV